MNWDDLEPIRIRIMQEAYDCADRDEPEAYNSIKVMCGEVLAMVEEAAAAEREACARVAEMQENRIIQTHPVRIEFDPNSMMARKCAAAIRARSET